MRVLLVDDQHDILTSLTFGLRYYGIETAGFDDPLDAIKSFKAGEYDAAVLDVGMPTMSGFELAKTLRALDPSLRILFLTAFESYEKELDKALPGVKIEGMLRKPVSIRVLSEKLRSIVIA